MTLSVGFPPDFRYDKSLISYTRNFHLTSRMAVFVVKLTAPPVTGAWRPSPRSLKETVLNSTRPRRVLRIACSQANGGAILDSNNDTVGERHTASIKGICIDRIDNASRSRVNRPLGEAAHRNAEAVAAMGMLDQVQTPAACPAYRHEMQSDYRASPTR